MRTDDTYYVVYQPSAEAAGAIEATVIAHPPDTPEAVLLAEFPEAIILECYPLNHFVVSRSPDWPSDLRLSIPAYRAS